MVKYYKQTDITITFVQLVFEIKICNEMRKRETRNNRDHFDDIIDDRATKLN